MNQIPSPLRRQGLSALLSPLPLAARTMGPCLRRGDDGFGSDGI